GFSQGCGMAQPYSKLCGQATPNF
ncbi:MAG: hypothetical protein EZS28_029510, partial [Streblomastix strix]